MVYVFGKLTIFKAESIYDVKCGKKETMKDALIAYNHWLVKLMSCNNLLLGRQQQQKDLSHVTGNLVGYLMSCIYKSW